MGDGADPTEVWNSTDDFEGDYEPRFIGYHDLMRYRVREILLVSSIYDAFILEEDGGLSEQIFGEYKGLELSSPPRVIRVSSAKKAMKELRAREYDMVITMTHLYDLDPVEFGREVKKIRPDIPVILLVTDLTDLQHYHIPEKREGIDKVFYWTGDSTLILAITKYFEDIRNVDADATMGMVRVILVVENSSRFYSLFLPQIFTEVMHQTKDLVAQGLNEHERLLRRRARPKILLAENYEEAMEIYDRFRDNLMAVITDVTYSVEGAKAEEAGFRLVEAIDDDIPVLMQSSHGEHRVKAEGMGISFLDKNSEHFLRDLRRFMKEEMGFGRFTFRTPDGEPAGAAFTMRDFTGLLGTVPFESLRFHAEANHFSRWLLARGEFELAEEIRPRKMSDFSSEEEVRAHLIEAFQEASRKKQLGVITDFYQQSFEFEETVTRFGGGSLGGKGRGIAFLSVLLHQSDMDRRFPGYKVRIPDTLTIGTEEFDRFIADNELHEGVHMDIPEDELVKSFLTAELSSELKEALRHYLDNVRSPIAVRSSSLLEDSYNQPFAGIYRTYHLPNDPINDERRFTRLCQAIKLVYASAFSNSAKAYIQASLRRSEEEKMAVVLQKLVGNRHGDRYYPLFSGVIQSQNFYPVPPLERDEPIANIALGLGKIVVDGGRTLPFSPSRPEAIPGFASPADIRQNSQNKFYALDLGNENFDLTRGEDATLLRLDVADAIDDGTLDLIASTYDPGDDRIRDSPHGDGPKLVTFAPMLKHGKYPLADILSELVDICRKGLGGPVEMEFAASMDGEGRPALNLLQIRPLLSLREHRHVAIEEMEPASGDMLVLSTKTMGNGVVDTIRDVLFVSRTDFDRGATVKIAGEIGGLNRELGDTPYILIGPGRWGSNDRWLGIPIDWTHISGARTIVETPMEDISVDPSHGSHFFHNVMSLGIPYLTVTREAARDHIDWEWLESHDPVSRGEHVRHLRFEEPLTVKVDGRCGVGLIMKSGVRVPGPG
jgi:hypothetical protein